MIASYTGVSVYLACLVGAVSSALLSIPGMLFKSFWIGLLRSNICNKKLVLVSQACVLGFAFVVPYFIFKLNFYIFYDFWG